MAIPCYLRRYLRRDNAPATLVVTVLSACDIREALSGSAV